MEKHNKTVSVIIPVYNRQAYLEECVQSVLDQSYQDFEIVLIDDGSTDKTLDICHALTESDSRIKLLTTEHVGVSAARNIGLDAARGEFVFFLDSDDIIHPRLFEALVMGMEESDAMMAGTLCRACSDKRWQAARERFIGDDSQFEVTYHDHQETLEAVFRHCSPFGMIGGVMMRRDLIGDTRFSTDLFIGEDFYFIYQNLIKNADTVFLKQRWYLVRNHDQNTSWQYDFDAFWTRFNRRVLVWQSEESFGRERYADYQKSDAFSCFKRCALQNKAYCDDMKRMRRVLREYKKEIVPALSLKAKVMYNVSAYLPMTTLCMLKARDRITQSRMKKRRA